VNAYDERFAPMRGEKRTHYAERQQQKCDRERSLVVTDIGCVEIDYRNVDEVMSEEEYGERNEDEKRNTRRPLEPASSVPSITHIGCLVTLGRFFDLDRDHRRVGCRHVALAVEEAAGIDQQARSIDVSHHHAVLLDFEAFLGVNSAFDFASDADDE